MPSRDLNELWEIVKSIPYGMCATYGDVARALENPVSGYTVGRWMAQAPEGVPWWRVVAKDGTLVIAKRNPEFGIVQRRHLEDEGIRFIGDQVDMTYYRYPLL